MNRISPLALALLVTAFDALAQHATHPAPVQAPPRTTTHAGHRMSTHRAPPRPSPAGGASPAVGNGMPSTPHDMHDMHHGTSATPPDAHGTTHDAPTTHQGMHHDRPATSHAMSGMSAGMPHMHHDMPAMSPGMDRAMPAMPHEPPAGAAPRTPVPEPTDADRAAAFPALGGHAAHDRARFGFLRVDRLERDDDGGTGWEAIGWYGGDVHRAWLRTEGHAAGGRVEDASVELLYGRLVAPWWDAVAGLRQDTGDGPSRRWAAFGVQGVAPYKFEVRATAYIGTGGRTAARLEGEYDTLLTNRAVLQWRAEADLYGRDDAARGLGRGLSTVAAGARLRYEITRRVAPYAGVEHTRAYGRTATLRAGDGHAARDTRVVAGLRLAF